MHGIELVCAPLWNPFRVRGSYQTTTQGAPLRATLGYSLKRLQRLSPQCGEQSYSIFRVRVASSPLTTQACRSRRPWAILLNAFSVCRRNAANGRTRFSGFVLHHRHSPPRVAACAATLGYSLKRLRRLSPLCGKRPANFDDIPPSARALAAVSRRRWCQVAARLSMQPNCRLRLPAFHSHPLITHTSFHWSRYPPAPTISTGPVT